MELVYRIFCSSVGKKYITALSGVGLILFLIGHLSGNLLIYLGPDKLNAYGHFLQTSKHILWPARIGMLLLITLHIWTAVQCWFENQAARPIGYLNGIPYGASWPSRYTMVTGLTLAAFILYHLLHYTVMVQALNLTGKNFHDLVDAHNRHDVYTMMLTGFSNGWVVLLYLVAMGFLAVHLWHGVSALFQTLGLRTLRNQASVEWVAMIFSAILFMGYVSIPLSIWLGILK